MVHKRPHRHFEKSGRIVQSIWSVCLGEIVSCEANGEIEEERNKNVNIVFKMFEKNRVEALVQLAKRL